MKKSQIILSVSVLIFLISIHSSAQSTNTDSSWSKWQSLIGNWKGTNSGEPGQGEGFFSFSYELNGNILMRKGHTVFAGHENQPTRVHEDILIVYKEGSLIPTKAIYFDSEEHVLHYNITYSDNGNIVLTTDAVPGSPIFRLSYIKMDNISMDVKFEAAPADHPEDFKVHVEGQVLKTN